MRMVPMMGHMDRDKDNPMAHQMPNFPLALIQSENTN